MFSISAPPTEPLISVIVPTYNYGHFIGQMLESLQAQTYPHWECIVVDDGSTDNTSKVVASYADKDDRIKYISQKNQGQPNALNTGIRNSTGKYLQFLDADDLIEAKKFARQVEYLERHPEVDIVYGGARYFRTENMDERLHSMWEENKPWMPEISGTGKDVLMTLIRNNIMVVNSPLVRRQVIDTLGLFDESLPPLQDWDYWIRCAADGKLFYYESFEGMLALVRSHPSSATKDRRRTMRAILRMRRKIEATFVDPDILRLNAELTAETEGTLGLEERLHGSLAKAIYQFFRAGILDKRIKYKTKWFVCAVIAPFVSKRQLKKIVRSSITQSVRGAFHQLQLIGRR